MATVPVARSTETLQPLPGQRQQAQRQDSGLGEGLQSLGQGLQQLAKGRQIYLDKVDEATVADLDSAAANDFREIERGFTSAQGKNAVDIAADTQKAWNETRASYLSRANNPAQARMLNQVLDRRSERWASQYDSHLTRQADTWQTQAFESRKATMAVDAAALPLGSTERLDAFLALGAVMDDEAARKGWDAETRKAQGLATFSEIHKSTVNALLESNDPHGAKEYLEANRGQMPVEMATGLSSRVREQVDVSDGRDWARNQVSFTAEGRPVQDVLDAIWGAQKNQESGNRQFDARGRLITSPVGAFGVAQLMPGTAIDIANAMGDPSLAAKARTDPAVNERMGRWYMGKQLEKYGLPSLALAAYNAGPGRVNRWLVTIGDPRNGDITEAEWTSRIPFNETRGYVQNILSKAGAGSGGVTTSIIPEGRAIEMARAAAGDDPRRQAAFEAAVTGERRRYEADLNDTRRAAREAVQTYLPNGATPVASWTDIPSREWSALDPEYQNSLRGVYASAASGVGKVETDQEVYGALLEMRALQPQRFARIDLTEYQDSLSPSDMRAMQAARLNIQAQPETPTNNPARVARQQAWPEVVRLANDAGIKTGKGATDEDRRELNGLQTYVDMEIEGHIRRDQSIMTREQIIAATARGLRTLPGRRQGLFGWGGQEEVRAFQVIVPAAAQTRIATEYSKVPGAPPLTADRMREIYMQGRALGEFE